MKKRRVWISIAALALVCTAALVCFAGCAPLNVYKATAIEWVSLPDSTYFVGDAFAPGDAAVQITYDNDQSRREVKRIADLLPSQYSLENFSTAERVFDKEVKFRYFDLELSFFIDVIEASDLKTVTFYPENGKEPFTERVVVGKSVPKPANPEKQGLALQDWITADGLVYNFSAALGGDLELHARYYALYSFYLDNRLLKSVRVTEGQSFNAAEAPSIPAKSGYAAAWRHNDSGKALAELNPREMEALPTADRYYASAAASTRFDAVYIPETYTVLVDILGGQIDSDQFEEENGTKNAVYVPFGYTLADAMRLFGKNPAVLDSVTKQGDEFGSYTFAGWFLKDAEGNFTTEVDPETTPIDAPGVIYARWQYPVVFALAVVEKTTVEDVEKIVIRNDYDVTLDPARYVRVMVDEGKAISEAEIPTREASEYYGFDRWWYRFGEQQPGNQPADITDRLNEASLNTILTTVGTPKNRPLYYETYYQIPYTVNFLIADETVGDGGVALPGVSLTVSSRPSGGALVPIRFGDKLLPSQVPGSMDIHYDKDGAALDFYRWYLDKTRDTVFDESAYAIDAAFSRTEFVGGTTVGILDLYADYVARIDWQDSDPIGARSGRVDETRTRLSRNNVTRADLPALKTNPNYDRNWYLEEEGTTAAFDEASGKLRVLKNCTLYAASKPKTYSVAFDLKTSDGAAVSASIAPERVSTDEPMRLPAAYSRWDAENGVQISGARDDTGKWEIEGYYRDAAFTERYLFVPAVADGETIYVSTDTFRADTTVYVRYTRVSTEGIEFTEYAGLGYYVRRPSGLRNLREIAVPETYRGVPVVGIDIGAFENFTTLERIYTPASIAEIRDRAFYGCSALAELPKTAADAKLGEAVFHDTAWYFAEWEKDYAKSGNYILIGALDAADTLLYEYRDGAAYAEFTVPEGVEIIGTTAFTGGGGKLTGVRLPLSLRIVRERAFYRVEGTGASGFSSVFAPGDNVERIESGAFYRLSNLRSLVFERGLYRTFENVLYEMESKESDRKNSLVAYPSAREADSFTTDADAVKTYYILDESVASIREFAFSACPLDFLVFRRGRASAISATTLPADFFGQFATATFYVPYDLDGEGNPVIKSYYAGYASGADASRVKPDAFLLNFRSPEADAFSETGWSYSVYASFADRLADYASDGYVPQNAAGLTLRGLYADESRLNPFADGRRVFGDMTVYEGWNVTLRFNERGVIRAEYTVALGSELTEAQLGAIAIGPLDGKNSEWSGTFPVFVDGAFTPTELFFGGMKGVKARYSGEYVVSDTEIVYRVVMKDPNFADAVYPEFDVPYGSVVPAAPEYAPSRDGLQFFGWYFGTADGTGYQKDVRFGEGGSVFNGELVRNYEGTPLADKRVPIYLWARWRVEVHFYWSSFDADGNLKPEKSGFTVSVDYGRDVPPDDRSEPKTYVGYAGSWAKYENGTYTDVAEEKFRNVTESFSVYANYRKLTVSVRFEAPDDARPDNAPSEIGVVEVGYGAAVGADAPADPVKSGYLFDGWYYIRAAVSDPASIAGSYTVINSKTRCYADRTVTVETLSTTAGTVTRTTEIRYSERFDPNRVNTENVTVYARFILPQEGADVYVPDGGENSEGLIYEIANPNAEDGLYEFRLVSAKAYSGKVLYLPTDIYGIGSGGGTVRLGTLKQIAAGAFAGNGAIEHVLIGASLNGIASGAFRNLPNLKKITVAAENGTYESIDGVLYGTVGSRRLLIKYPSKKEGTDFSMPTGREFGFAEYAFESPEYLSRLVITGGKPYLTAGAFSGIAWDTFKIFVPTKDLNQYCNKTTHTYDQAWLNEISATYIERVFQGATVVVRFIDPLTSEEFTDLRREVELYQSISDPGSVPDPAGYTFQGWCSDREGLVNFAFGQPLSEETTVYARYQRNGTKFLSYRAISASGGGITGYEVSIGEAKPEADGSFDVVVPNFNKGHPVIKISAGGFMNAKITSLELPYTLKEIGDGALVGLSELRSIRVDDLDGRINAKEFVAADNVLYNKDRTRLILYPAASDARTAFTVPDGVLTIGEYAFYLNRCLKTVTLPASVARIENNAFGLSGLSTVTLNAPERVALTDANAFSDTSADLRIFVDHAILNDYLADGSGWTNLKAKIYGKTATIDYYYDETEFLYRDERRTFTSVPEPRYGSTGDTVGKNLTKIIASPPDGKSFRYWIVRATGEKWDFATATLLRDVELVAYFAPATELSAFVDNTPGDPNNAKISLSSNYPKDNLVSLTIPSVLNGKTVTAVYMGGFKDLPLLQEVVFPVSLTAIEWNAFKNCVSLRSLTFPESVQTIGESAFEGCASLRSVRLPSNLSTIQARAFKNCSALETFDFGAANVVELGDEAFYGCASLLTPALPQSLTTIGASCFEGAVSVTALDLPEKLRTVGNRAFAGMSKLIRAYFNGSSLTNGMGDSVFEGCAALNEARLPSGLSTVTQNMFAGDVALRSVAIPDSVLTIADNAFLNCVGLISVTFGSGLREVRSNAFSGASLSTLDFPASLDTLGDYAFDKNRNLERVYLKREPVSVGTSVFGTPTAELRIFAETDAVYDGYLRFLNFSQLYQNRFLKRFVSVTFRYVDEAGNEIEFTPEAYRNVESDKTIGAPDEKSLDNFACPAGTEDYVWKSGFWYFERKAADGSVSEVVWNFRTDTIRENTTLIMRYVVAPAGPGASSDGLLFRNISGDRYEVVGVGALYNKQTIVVPNYYNEKPVASIASGFLDLYRGANLTVVIPDTVTRIAEDAFRSAELARFVVVGSAEPRFFTDNGALYGVVSGEQVRLIRYPSRLDGEQGEYRLRSPSVSIGGAPASLRYIGEYAFEYNRFRTYSVDAELPFHAADGALYEGADGAASETLVSYPNLKDLIDGAFTLPSDVRRIYKAALSLTVESKLKAFRVDAGNTTYFTDAYGVLYRADADESGNRTATLVRMPANFGAEGDTYVVNGSVAFGDGTITLVGIAEGAFENVMLVRTIVFSPGEGEAPPALSSMNAFTNCAAYLLVDNENYDEFKKLANWSDSPLYKRFSYVVYQTDGAIPEDVAAKYRPAGYTGGADGFVIEVQSITQLQDPAYVLGSEIRGLLRIPFSDVEGWYDEYGTKLAFGATGTLVKTDMTLIARWVVESKASKPEGGSVSDYFSFYPVVENGTTVSYEVMLNMSGGITELTELVIPSYYSPDGSEKNKLPVTGFYDDGTDATRYNGFTKLETLVLPETFRKFRNIFRTEGEVSPPSKLKRLVILSKEEDFLRPKQILETTVADLRDLVALVNNADFGYFFQDYNTYSAYRQNTVWGQGSTAASMRGKLMTNVIDLRVVHPETGEEAPRKYLRLLAGVETLSSYEGYGTELAPTYAGYIFEGWELYSVSFVNGAEQLTPIGDADPDTTVFGGTEPPSTSERNDRFVLKAKFSPAPPQPETP